MSNTNEIIDILKSHKKILKKNIRFLKWHCLVLMQEAAIMDSDIDILVDFNERIDGFDYIRIAHELEDVLKHEIDLVSRKGIKPRYLPL